MSIFDDYELVCGLEVHVELKTETKIFCSCPTAFGAEPNTQCCPICAGLPGALPVLNRRVVELAVRAGLALGCEISSYSIEERKNYFYPDLPKAYQISQLERPLCTGGHVDIISEGKAKRIGITQIHIEEDAGKLIHGENGTLIDLNRCGVPLIEIVSEPDIRSAKEAADFARRLRSILMFAGVSDCKMNEGSLRCDVNLSVRKKGDTALGTRTETKNINSFTFVEKAVESEFRRQVELVSSGQTVKMETRRFDASTGSTETMRVKETADDYRYFPDPDLPPIELDESELERIRLELPRLPDERRAEYLELGLCEKDADQLISELELSELFDAARRETEYPKLLANLILGELLSVSEGELIASPSALAGVSRLCGAGTINSSTAKKLVRLLHASAKRGESLDPETYVRENELMQIRDPELLRGIVKSALDSDPKAVAAYRAGKTSAAKAIMGRIMAMTKGRGDPVLLDELLCEALKPESEIDRG